MRSRCGRGTRGCSSCAYGASTHRMAVASKGEPLAESTTTNPQRPEALGISLANDDGNELANRLYQIFHNRLAKIGNLNAPSGQGILYGKKRGHRNRVQFLFLMSSRWQSLQSMADDVVGIAVAAYDTGDAQDGRGCLPKRAYIRALRFKFFDRTGQTPFPPGLDACSPMDPSSPYALPQKSDGVAPTLFQPIHGILHLPVTGKPHADEADVGGDRDGTLKEIRVRHLSYSRTSLETTARLPTSTLIQRMANYCPDLSHSKNT